MKTKLLLYALLIALGHSIAILFACSTDEESCDYRTQTSINCKEVDKEFVERIRFYQEECLPGSVSSDAKFFVHVKPNSFLVNGRDSVSISDITTITALQSTLTLFCAVEY